MLIAAAVCPHPPLLIPEAAGTPGPGGTELPQLRAACQQALSALRAERPDLIAVVGADPRARRTAEYPPQAPGRLDHFGVPFTTGQAEPGTPSLPLSLTVGKWLLSRAARGHPAPPAVWWGIAPDSPPAECRRLGEKLAALAPRVALLAMGDGPGRRAARGPGRRRSRSRPLRRPGGGGPGGRRFRRAGHARPRPGRPAGHRRPGRLAGPGRRGRPRMPSLPSCVTAAPRSR